MKALFTLDLSWDDVWAATPRPVGESQENYLKYSEVAVTLRDGSKMTLSEELLVNLAGFIKSERARRESISS